MRDTYYTQKEQEKGDTDHLIFQEMEADLCESWHGRKQDNESWWSKGEVASRILEHDKEKELSSTKICWTLTGQGNPSFIWDKNPFIHLAILKKKPLNCSCQIIRKFLGVLLYPLRSVLHLPFSMKHFQGQYHAWNNITMCTKLFVSP